MATIDEEWDSWSRASLGNERFLQPDTYKLCFEGGWHSRHRELDKLEEQVRKLTRQNQLMETRQAHAFMFAQLRQADCDFAEGKLDAVGRIAFDNQLSDVEKVTKMIDVVVGWMTGTVGPQVIREPFQVELEQDDGNGG